MNAATPYDRDAIFDDAGPFPPGFTDEAIRTIMRTLPLDPTEPRVWACRRMRCALIALSALHPRDEIELMIGVQAMSAYHAAAACWRIGMNLRRPNGDSTRHISAAATAARTFDTMLRALERRQAKALSVPPGRPEGHPWPAADNVAFMNGIEDRCRRHETNPESTVAVPVAVWSPADVAAADAFLEAERVEKENAGLDIANTDGILPGGGMILMEDPTPQQAAYMGRRLRLMYQRERHKNMRDGGTGRLKIRPIRPGDVIP